MHLGDESPLFIALYLGQVWVGAAVNHNLIQNFILLPLHRLTSATDFTEEAHAQCDVHAPHLLHSDTR